MQLPRPGIRWDPTAESAMRAVLMQADAQNLKRGQPAEVDDLRVAGDVGFYGATPAVKPEVTGSRGGNAALESLLTALADLGLITDSSDP